MLDRGRQVAARGGEPPAGDEVGLDEQRVGDVVADARAGERRLRLVEPALLDERVDEEADRRGQPGAPPVLVGDIGGELGLGDRRLQRADAELEQRADHRRPHEPADRAALLGDVDGRVELGARGVEAVGGDEQERRVEERGGVRARLVDEAAIVERALGQRRDAVGGRALHGDPLREVGERAPARGRLRLEVGAGRELPHDLGGDGRVERGQRAELRAQLLGEVAAGAVDLGQRGPQPLDGLRDRAGADARQRLRERRAGAGGGVGRVGVGGGQLVERVGLARMEGGGPKLEPGLPRRVLARLVEHAAQQSRGDAGRAAVDRGPRRRTQLARRPRAGAARLGLDEVRRDLLGGRAALVQHRGRPGVQAGSLDRGHVGGDRRADDRVGEARRALVGEHRLVHESGDRLGDARLGQAGVCGDVGGRRAVAEDRERPGDRDRVGRDAQQAHERRARDRARAEVVDVGGCGGRRLDAVDGELAGQLAEVERVAAGRGVAGDGELGGDRLAEARAQEARRGLEAERLQLDPLRGSGLDAGELVGGARRDDERHG